MDRRDVCKGARECKLPTHSPARHLPWGVADTTVPIEIAARFLRRKMPKKTLPSKRRRDAVWRMGGDWVVGGPALKGSGKYPKAFGESMAKMAIHLLSDGSP